MSPEIVSEIKFLFGKYALPQLKSIFFLTFLMAITVSAELFAPFLLQRTIDSATASDATWGWYSVWFFAVTLVGMLVRVVITTQTTNVAFTITNALRVDLLRHVIGLGVTHREKTPVGDTVEVIEGQVVGLQNILSILGGQAIVQLIIVAGALIILFTVHPLAGLGFAAYIVTTVILMRNPPALTSGLQERVGQTQVASSAMLFSLLNARSDLSLNRGQAFALRGFQKSRSAYVPAHRAAIASSVIWFGRASSLLATSTAFALALGGVLHVQGVLSLGTVLLLTRLASIMTTPLLQLRGHYDEIAFSISSLGQIRKLRMTEQDLPDPANPAPPPSDAPHVVITNLGFSYGSKEALRTINLDVPAHALVGIVGASGSGKSTLGQLLTRTRDPNTGSIQVDGVDLRSLATEDRFRFVYMVDQDQTQLHGTLEQNLAVYGDIAPERLQRAKDVLITLHPPFRQFQGGVMPETLSDGELQLVALARALVSDAKLLVLDEVNARLDPQMRKSVLRVIAELTREKTVFVIAHRPETLEVCSHVMLLEHGVLKDFGPRDRMLSVLARRAEVWQ